MNPRAILSGIVLTVLAILMPVEGVFANGIIISKRRRPSPQYPIPGPRPRPIREWMPFRVESQRVDVAINDAIAETTIEQVFVNRSRGTVEGTYMFPISESAALDKFSMWMNGKETHAELLDADRARKIYNDIVSRMRDPGLLQFAGRGLIQARVFPIPAGGKCRIKLSYTQQVEADSGLTRYVFPMGAKGCRLQPIETFSLRAVIRSARALGTAFSPTHDCSFDRRGDQEIVVGLENPGSTDVRDFQLFYDHRDGPFGLSLLTYRAADEDGYFMARLTPRLGGPEEAILPKNIAFVLDTSGSMADDDKIAQARRAIKFCITNLGREDRFNIVSFATEVRTFRDAWCKAEEGVTSAAKSFVDDLRAVGGTDINAALAAAMRMNPGKSGGIGRGNGESWRRNPFFIVFMTDGEPTVGVTDLSQILKNVEGANADRQARIFTLGVGFKVNTKLLDRLSDDNGGARGYVTPKEDLELKLSSFYTKLANPVLADVKLAFKGVSVHELYPRRFPDMFKGTELVVLGRFGRREYGPQKIELSGKCRGEGRGFAFDCRFDESGRHDFLPRVWAMRKIGFLLDELRLNGPSQELKNEVIRLSKKFGILTPYTSFLVQEDERIAMRHRRAPVGPRPMSPAMRGAFADQEADMKEAAIGQTAEVGKKSVEGSASNRAFRRARGRDLLQTLGSVAALNTDRSGQQLVNFVGARTFYFERGRWVDSEFDGKAKTIKLPLYSPRFYEFLGKNPAAGSFIAQGDRVIFQWEGNSYETIQAAADGVSIAGD